MKRTRSTRHRFSAQIVATLVAGFCMIVSAWWMAEAGGSGARAAAIVAWFVMGICVVLSQGPLHVELSVVLLAPQLVVAGLAATHVPRSLGLPLLSPAESGYLLSPLLLVTTLGLARLVARMSPRAEIAPDKPAVF